MLRKKDSLCCLPFRPEGAARAIDIRESSEYAENFIPEARLVPLSIAKMYPLKDADAPEKPIIFYCRSGNRTDKILSYLADLQTEQKRGNVRRSFWLAEGRGASTV